MTNQERSRREGNWDVPDTWRGDDTRGWAAPPSTPGYSEAVYQGHPSRETGYQPRGDREISTVGYRGSADVDRYATPAIPRRGGRPGMEEGYDRRGGGRPQEASQPWYGDGGTSQREWFGSAARQESGAYDRGYGTMRGSQGSGPHSGRGPKGYRRADDRICEDVCEALTQHGDIDASEVEVRVEQGEVILSGMVEDRRQKRLAEDLAERCSGVQDVRNELRVSSTAHRTGTATGTPTTYSGNASRTASGPGEPAPAGNGKRKE